MNFFTNCACDYIDVYRYIGKKLKQVDERLMQILLPDVINRSPRSVNERKFWKGQNVSPYSLDLKLMRLLGTKSLCYLVVCMGK